MAGAQCPDWTGTASTLHVAPRHSSPTAHCAPGINIPITVESALLGESKDGLTTLENFLTFWALVSLSVKWTC